ncbi:MAG: hypothetical protein DFNUSKGM_002257 [Candidatus Fervidibacter sacchari]
MMQQWQQMPEQQKKIAIVLSVVIVLALVLIVWMLMPRRPATTTQEVAQQPTVGAPTHGAGGQAPEMFEEQMMPPGMMGQVGAPAAPMVGPTMGAPTGAPEVGAPTPPPPGKLENPPRPGRPDPFADLPSTGKVSPFTPVVLPPTPEPVVLAKAQAGSIGTETFSLQDIETNIPTLQAQSVNLRSYFAPPQPIRTVRELSGWRLAGTILTEGSIGAIVQTPDGRTRSVRLGDKISYGGTEYTVTQVDEQKIMLRDSKGDEYTLTRRPAASLPMPPYGGVGGFTPGGFGPLGPGGFGPGGFAPGGFGPGGFGPGGY